MGSTLTIVLVIAAVAVLAVLAVLLSRGKKPSLPRETGQAAAPTASSRLPAAASRAGPESAAPAAAPPGRAPAPTAAKAPAPASPVAPDVLHGPPAVPPPTPKGSRPGPTFARTDEVATLKRGLASTRGGFIARLGALFGGRPEIDPALFDQIEEVLIGADIGVKTTQRIVTRLREGLSKRELTDGDRVWASIRSESLSILTECKGGLTLTHSPSVIAVIGVNGVGKTTTIGKLASRLSAGGKQIVLAAGDTFRAAAVLQLEVWGKRVGCPVVKGKENADPSSVVFDAIKRAETDGADVVIIDTAGRLQTKLPLMEELKKVVRTIEKALGRPADEILLVLDATNGQNAVQQAQLFREAVPVSGIVLTKLDGTAKGGIVLGIVDEHHVPIRFIGIGERLEDLHEFDAASFVTALFEKPESASSAA